MFSLAGLVKHHILEGVVLDLILEGWFPYSHGYCIHSDSNSNLEGNNREWMSLVALDDWHDSGASKYGGKKEGNHCCHVSIMIV